MSLRTVACLTIAIAAPLLAGADWPQWRGPLGTGHATEPLDPPREWSPTKNVAWKTPLPGPGNSTPIVVGDRVLVSARPSKASCDCSSASIARPAANSGGAKRGSTMRS